MSKDKMAYPPGLVLHGSTYRVQKRVPADCVAHYGKPMLYFRTGCADKREAALVAWKWLAEIEAEFDRIRKTGSPRKATITDEEAERLCDLMLASRLGADEEIRISGELANDWQYKRHLDTLSEHEESTRQVLARGIVDGYAQQAMDWLVGYGYDIDPDSEEFRALVFRFAKKSALANKVVRARDDGDFIETPQPGDTSQVAQRQLMLSEVIKYFLDNRDKTQPMFKKYQTVLPLMLEVIGDKPVSQITQMDIEEFFRDICKLPPRWRAKIHQTGMSVRQLMSLNHETCIAPKTFEDTYVAAVRPFLNESKRLFSDPQYGDYRFPLHLTTEGIRYRGTRRGGERKQRPFKPEELKRLFEGPEFASFARKVSDAPKYWLPLIGLYTGARVNEICQLNPQIDIKTDVPVPYFEFTAESEADERIRKSIKNQTSVRLVPIHPVLIGLGFLDFARRQKDAGYKLLFPDWPPSRGKASAKAEKWFRDFMVKLGLRDETPGKTLLGMHAFRHTLLNRAYNLGVANAEAITGHSRDTSAVVQGYEGELELPNKLALLSKITFDVTPPKVSDKKISEGS